MYTIDHIKSNSVDIIEKRIQGARLLNIHGERVIESCDNDGVWTAYTSKDGDIWKPLDMKQYCN